LTTAELKRVNSQIIKNLKVLAKEAAAAIAAEGSLRKG